MYQTHFFRLLAAVFCILALAVPVAAAEVESGSIYCFQTDDFSGEDSFSGICITDLPDSSTGTLMLGCRVIRAGDILTAEQTARLTFSPLDTRTDKTAQVEYLPIYDNHVAPCSVMDIRIRGKEDKAPIAEDSAAETYRDIPNTASLKVSDPEGQALTFSVIRQPRRGSVVIGPDGTFTYTPKQHKVGVDSFTYTAADPAGNVSREATVTITILKPGKAPTYTDTAGQDCQFTAEWMKHTGIFTGETLDGQSCFQPHKTVTRGEFVTMLVNALDIPTDEYLTYTGYTDEIPGWLQPYLAAAIRSGLTAGLPDQEVFDANAPITGGEAAVMLCNALDLTPSREAIALSQEDVPDWAAAALGTLSSFDIQLDAMLPLTRGQVSQILYRSTGLAAENRIFPQ